MTILFSKIENDVIIGCLGRPFGVHGFLNLNSYTNPPKNILDFLPWKINFNNNWQEAKIEKVEQHANRLVIKLLDYNDRNQASLLTNSLIAIHRSRLPALSKNEYYWSDLTGLTVINQKNIELGQVSHLFATGANDVLVIAQNNNKKQHLIPFINNTILSVDLEKKVIFVDWDEDF